MSRERPPGRIEVGELRERLRSLGYLDAGVDRFVLAPASRERSSVGLAWRVSVRIGLLAALLLGPAAAIGIESRLPGLIAGPRDALVVTIYLALFFGVAAAVLSLAAALAVRGFARRTSARAARRLAMGAGSLVGLGCLAYLTLWWNATGGVWTAPGRTFLAVGAAVAVSLLLGHASAIATLALIARDQETLPAPVMSWRTILGVGAVGFLAASGLLAASVLRGGNSPPRPSEFAIVPTGVRVVVIAIDGFDPRLFDEIARTGGAPRLEALRLTKQVQVGPVDTDPARVWTTVATGVAPEEHGVAGLELRRVAGLEGTVRGGTGVSVAVTLARVTDLLRLTRPAAISGVARRHRTFWEVAAEKGLDAAVVNWWATWPATNTRATVISERAPLRLERGGPQSGEIAPAALYGPLRARWPGISKQARAIVARVAWSVTPPWMLDVLVRSATIDAQQVLLAREAASPSADLLAVYLPGLDIAQHALLQEEGGAPLSPSALAIRIEALRRYYTFLDSVIAELLAARPAGTTVITVTHPGRLGSDATPTIAVSGPIVAHRHDAGSVSLSDVAPTVLYLLGVPVSRALAGEPLVAFFDDRFLERFPVRYVDTYGAYSTDVPASEGVPLDKEMIERLRSLGYIR